MNKLIQTVILTAVVFSPLTLIGLATSASAHHTASHVSTVATITTKTTKVKINTAKKSVRNVIRRTNHSM